MAQTLAALALRRSLIVAALLGMAASVHAQTYPARPVTVIFPYASPSDVGLRAVLSAIEKSFGQNIVVESRTGGNEVPAMVAVLNAAADGYTIGGTSQNLSLNPAMQKLPYTQAQFAAITRYAVAPNMFLLRQDFPAKNVQEFINYAKANPGKVNVAAVGNYYKISWLIFEERAGIKLTLIPYRSGGDAIPGLASGSIDVMTVNLNTSQGLVKDGRARIIAATGMERMAQLPDVPTMAETVPGFTIAGWQGLVAKAGTPRPIIERWARGVREALKTPEVIKMYQTLSFSPMADTPEELAEHIRKETETFERAAKQAGIVPE